MQELFAIFDEIGLPYYRQGSLSDEDYPASFFTHWNIDTPSLRFRDNSEISYVEIISVCFYTNDANLIYTQMEDFISRAKAAGFIVPGHAHDTDADKENYYGRYIRIQKIHKS